MDIQEVNYGTQNLVSTSRYLLILFLPIALIVLTVSFSQLTGDTPVGTLPAYDLQKVDDSNFLLSVSVPGWKDDELEIETVGESAYFRETPGNRFLDRQR